ncbi:MAG: fatty acid oxidation complex subunit alpha FadB [Vibrio sp.]
MIYQNSGITLTLHPHNLIELCFCASGSVNKLDLGTLSSLNDAIDVITQHETCQGVILTSDKASFIVGADITQFLTLFRAPSEELSAWLRYANYVFNRLEDLALPTVSALSGYVLGGGCECVLTTDFRIGDDTTKIGLPETQLGIIPGFGGTVRLPRLIGVDNALEAITQGRHYSANQALSLGLLDAIVDSSALLTSAIATLTQSIQHPDLWQKRRARKKEPLRLAASEQMLSFNMANALVKQKVGTHYPAPIAAIEVIKKSATQSRQQAQQNETAAFTELVQHASAHALVGLFLNDQFIKNHYTSDKVPPAENQLAVIGAGIMGGGIAYQIANHDLSVTLKDIQQEALTLGLNEVSSLLNKQLARGKISGERQAQVLTKIQPTLFYHEIQQATTIIEAVVENPAIKSTVLSEIEAQVAKDSIIASNTSTIPISELAKALQHPERFCGMHFFNPVHRMPLVEIIRGEKTSQATIDHVTSLAMALGKTPVVVNDCPGFFVNRVLFPYLAAFRLLIRDGVDFTRIDQIMEHKFGWPMGPAYILDVVGLDTAYHAQQVMNQGYPERFHAIEHDILTLLYQEKLLGQKTQAGFYCYSKDRKGNTQKSPNPDAITLIESIPKPDLSITDDEIIERMMIPMLNEVLLCLEEQIVATPQEADMALVYGLGFPPFHGGPCQYLATLGLTNYSQQLDKYHHLGALYHSPPLLTTMQEKNSSFYQQRYQSDLPQVPSIQEEY